MDGITLQESERQHAERLGIPNYQVWRLNKYDQTLARRLGRSYDLLVDNNPSAFACCWRHFCVMMLEYQKLLRSGGQLLTEARGLAHSVTGNHSRWCFSFEDWSWVGLRLGLVPLRLTETVFALEKPARLG